MIHLCATTTDQQFTPSFGQLLCTFKKQGIDINRPVNGITALHKACYAGNINVVKILLENGADINAEDIYKNTPLHFACKEGNIEVIKELLKIPAALDLLTIKNISNKTPVELIPETNKEVIVSLIAEAKNMHSKDKNLSLDKVEDINNLSVNQQMPKNNSEQVSNDELQNDLKLTELLLIGHTEDTFSECYGA
ncbi:MAG: ankyrin repeat domain-containing protein [Rickettsia endosymbiont of Pseudomimeciton antennatum]|nr:ankyrin repeat domain-containing protein [Rickettsia endosymbiont of Pseudomimeciton antennatum]